MQWKGCHQGRCPGVDYAWSDQLRPHRHRWNGAWHGSNVHREGRGGRRSLRRSGDRDRCIGCGNDYRSPHDHRERRDLRWGLEAREYLGRQHAPDYRRFGTCVDDLSDRHTRCRREHRGAQRKQPEWTWWHRRPDGRSLQGGRSVWERCTGNGGGVQHHWRQRVSLRLIECHDRFYWDRNGPHLDPRSARRSADVARRRWRGRGDRLGDHPQQLHGRSAPIRTGDTARNRRGRERRVLQRGRANQCRNHRRHAHRQSQ